jgi:SAGA-associated factor 29
LANRYEVQDPEPDENGAPGQIYKSSAAALIAIPSADAVLPDFQVGKHVLARYPETTTFYRAEVTGAKKDVYRLKFEDDQNQEMEVNRRFVLDFSPK